MKNANEKNIKKKQNTSKKNDQSKQINKNVKKKKDNTKALIDNPFSLDWPSIDNGNHSKVVSCLKLSFKDYLSTLKKTEECENNKESTIAKVSGKTTKNPLSKVNPACIIFGYNAVMRGLEKENIKIVLVNAGASPKMLIKSFVPICNLQSIPLIPVNNLSQIFGDIGIRSTLAVGFTLVACEKEGPFHKLFISCCEALDYDDNRESLSSSKEPSKSKGNEQSQLEDSKKANTNISSYHLNRENRKKRVFEPPKRENPCLEFFIKLGKDKPLNFSANLGSNRNNKRKAANAFKKDSTSSTKATLPEVPELSFYIDVNNDDIDLEEEKKEECVVNEDKPVKKKFSTVRYFEALNSDSKIKAHYIPAKIKKIKASSKRHP